ncbi:MAG: hypothetical protein JWO62_854 [Acidimicrobiaceae bacterium]|nr:hypothetical protein [Acidimicrobiaceae bacterium]
MKPENFAPLAPASSALLVVAAGHGGLRAMLRDSIEEAGGYPRLAAAVAADEPDLA